jgi:glycerate kinase
VTNGPPTVLIAPDKFKGSLPAAGVVESVAHGLVDVRPEIEIIGVPVADGGDGTLAAALRHGFTLVPVPAAGPTGRVGRTGYARRGAVAVVELAAVCGLGRLPDGVPAPLTATSRGVGEVVAAAARAGCRSIVLGVGGSASTDGGAGLIRGLGGRLLDRAGHEVPDGGAGLASIASLDLTAVRELLRGVRLVLASDVDNPLVGPNGAAVGYGPQKGATQRQVQQLDDALAHWADVVAASTGQDHRHAAGAGAAGGVGFAALALLGASRRPGIDVVLGLVGFGEHLARADLVITGEGALDEQTLRGKAPAGVTRAARTAGVPVVAVCGRRELSLTRLREHGIVACYALTDLEPDLGRCLDQAPALLRQVGRRVAAEHLAPAG